LLDCLVALMEEVEHLAGVQLGAALEPFGALWLGGGVEVVLGCLSDLVLAALSVGQAEVGHLQARIDEIAGLAGVLENTLVGGNSTGAVALVLGEVGLFEAEEIVAGELLGQAALNGEGLGIARIVAKEEGESGAALDGVDDSMRGALAKEIEALLLVAGDASNADHDAQDAGERGDGELLDSDGHLGVGVVRVDAEGLFAVLAGGEALPGSADVAVIDQGDEGGVHSPGIAAGEVGVGVVGIGLDLLIAEIDDEVGELLDAVARGLGNGDVALGGEKGVVGVVGGVEEILMVELAEDEGHQDVIGRHGILGAGALDGFEAGESAVVVEVVEERVGLPDLRRQIERIRMQVGGLRERRDEGQAKKSPEKKRAYEFMSRPICHQGRRAARVHGEFYRTGRKTHLSLDAAHRRLELCREK